MERVNNGCLNIELIYLYVKTKFLYKNKDYPNENNFRGEEN